MSRLFLIIAIICIAFALASLLTYRLHSRDAKAPPPPAAIDAEVQTTEGQIGSVDTDKQTLTLVDGDRLVIFEFDERTAIVEAGHAVQPALIPQGAPASVRYSRRGDKNWARKIELLTR